MNLPTKNVPKAFHPLGTRAMDTWEHQPHPDLEPPVKMPVTGICRGIQQALWLGSPQHQVWMPKGEGSWTDKVTE